MYVFSIDIHFKGRQILAKMMAKVTGCHICTADSMTPLCMAKVCKICLKTFLVHWPLPDRCTLLGSCSTYGSKMIFSQYRVYGYQKTQNFT
jgi:hypothetical protein